jgi:hypothetical protein
MTFQECELAILRAAIDKRDEIEGEKLLKDPEVKIIISIVEDFLVKKKLVCYGGTAINAVLPTEDQFYDMSLELPDYDFFSPNALKDAKELADIYYKKGFTNVEARAGVHLGTYKVFVNFIPVADITQILPEIFKSVKRTAININGINFASPNFLRMSMYLELSRPNGDITRWEKILKRISLLNKNYPLRGQHCNDIEIQRFFDPEKKLKKGIEERIFYITRDTLINQGVVFFGAMAIQIYLRFLKKYKYHKFKKIPDFDVLSLNPKQTATILKDSLSRGGIKNISINKKEGVGEIIAPHYEVTVKGETIVIIYEPLACHSYNVTKLSKKTVKIASIDTMLSFYLAFIHINRKYYDPNRILCMAEFLFKIQQKNRLNQKGVLKRFSIDCYGQQETYESIRAQKKARFEQLKNSRYSKEWDKYFLRYIPEYQEKRREKNKLKTKKTRKKNLKVTPKKKKSKTLKSKLNKFINIF